MLRTSLPLALLAITIASPAAAQTWEQISAENGITVWQREVAGTSLVEFRGRAVIRASIKKVLAVLRDQKRKTEWMANCVGNRGIEYKSVDRLIVYNRTGSPVFFINDRDVVVESTGRYAPDEKAIFIDFKNTEHQRMPPVDGVVRMPKLSGHWYLFYRDPQSTEVEYQVQADPGGAIPKWLVNMASKTMPSKTIENLRAQVKKSGYDDELAVLDMSYDWSPLDRATASSTTAKTP